MIRNLVIVLLFAFIFIGCERMETMESTYPNFEAAVKADAVGEGKWIPDFLPHSSTSIRERHNLDTNEQWLSFNFSGENDPILNSCKKTTLQEIEYPRRSPGNWWPQTLIQDSDKQQKTNYVYYKCQENDFLGIMALNMEKGEGYYWLIKKISLRYQ